MNSPVDFTLTRNGAALLTTSLAEKPVTSTAIFDAHEMQQYGFELINREADTEYGVWIGDIEVGRCSLPNGHQASTIGAAKGRYVLWDDAQYFEGCRGFVKIRLRSRRTPVEGNWIDRAVIQVVVSTGKMSNARYRAMLDQMSSLASGMILDLVSKSTLGKKLALTENRAQVQSSEVELGMLETIWPLISHRLTEIAKNPSLKLGRKMVTANCWGNERFDSRAVAAIARNGNDPRIESSTVPFRARISRIQESSRTHEHQVIRAFLDLLLQRARDCERNVIRHVAAIEQDKVWRNRAPAGGRSLYIEEDIPRLEQLRRRLVRTQELIRQVSLARQMRPFVDARPVLSLQQTPVFANVEPYREVRRQLVRFLRSSLVIVDEGDDFRVKSTGRLYEQWVFLQLIAAFRSAGLSCASQQGILHTSQQFRFTLDLDRGAKATFVGRDGRGIVVRYEPWVTPLAEARQNLDSVYRGSSGKTAWSPDILIEFLSNSEQAGSPPLLDYAVVIDAKYSATIRDHHWNNTDKYLQIRATQGDRQIVRQQWLAYPGSADDTDSSITFRDSMVRWTPSGPDVSREDTVQGTLMLRPPSVFKFTNQTNGWISSPERAACEFAAGLLRYMGISTPDAADER